ncbi:unnamed protein product [Ceutorhynchus assimilis]|uniref:Uncharacterized protein n=1 Tax=Ceutorhynchus assimilis TaxID=467358 RepID=A0A9N9QQI5_9CUCU|nr:unnamed protein product [Ceutorhynchus assimilis]
MEASVQLSRQSSDEQEEVISGKRNRRSSSSSAKKSRIHTLEERQERIEYLLEELIDQRRVGETPSEDDQDENEERETMANSESDIESGTATSTKHVWQAPPLSMENEDITFHFKPATKQLDPIIPELDEALKTDAINCQCLKTSAWNKIRYVEAQKRLQASGIFSQLKRKALVEKMQEIIKEHPEVTNDLKETFSLPDANFRNISDNLLQYVCGKRAEIIEARRKLYEPNNSITAQLMREIPPSETHLFDEQKLETLLSNPPKSTFPSYRHRNPFSSKHLEEGRTRKEPNKMSSKARFEKPMFKKKPRPQSKTSHKFDRQRDSGNKKSSGTRFRRP